MSTNGHFRASDADRDQVAERLRTAATEGRIATDELEQRLEATLAARTYADLADVVADLPANHPARRRSGLPTTPVARVALALTSATAVVMVMIFVMTGIIAGWLLWAIAGWWFFGHRHRTYGAHWRRHQYASRPRHIQRRAGAGPASGFWG